VEIREGREELAVGDPAAALARFERAHALAPDDPGALRGLALSELELGHAHASLRWFDRLERVDPHALDAELTVARCRALRAAVAAEIEREAWAEAIELVEQTPAGAVCGSAGLASQAIEAHMAEAVRALEAGDLERAVEHLEWVLAEEPGHPDATLQSVELMLREGARGEALRLLSEALAHHPGDGRLVEKMVDVLSDP
jgi:tetratricopeptide (TPR) repeat protein